MPLSPAFVDRITLTLNSARPVRVKKMFGGLGIYHDEVFFAIADDDRLYFKVDAQSAPHYEAQGMGPWVSSMGTNLKYREVPPSALKDPAELGTLIDGAVEVARKKKG